eukprot:796424-Alexandrium_andersonii.AAC.1
MHSEPARRTDPAQYVHESCKAEGCGRGADGDRVEPEAMDNSTDARRANARRASTAGRPNAACPGVRVGAGAHTRTGESAPLVSANCLRIANGVRSAT